MAVSKQTGFLPEEEKNVNNHDSITTVRIGLNYSSLKRPTDTQEKVNTLPPVIRDGKLDMKVEIKKLRNQGTCKANEEIFELSSKHDTGATNTSESSSTLPPINETSLDSTTKESLNLEHLGDSHASKSKSFDPETKAKLENPIEEQYPIGASHKHLETNHVTKTSPTNVNVRVVSIGEVITINGRPKPRNTRQRRNSGHLSLGWSSPQPLEPITGSPMTTPTRHLVSENKGNKNELVTEKEDKKSANTCSMTIKLNVNTVLDETKPVPS